MLEEIRDLYAYNKWANERLLTASAALSEEQLTRDLRSSFPSVLATLTHILQAEWVWLERWTGNSPTGFPDAGNLGDTAALRQKWEEIEGRRQEFFAGLTDERLKEELRYRTIHGDEFRAPLWQLLRHVANHSTYHRGQVTTLLRQLGASPPSTDLVLFHRERAAR